MGNIDYVNRFRERSAHSVKGRSIIDSGERAELREDQSPYNAVFDSENVTLRPENTYFWSTSE